MIEKNCLLSVVGCQCGVLAAIRRAGGNAIALDAAKKIPVALGDVAVTTAGKLRAHYVFHAVTLGAGKEKTDPQHEGFDPCKLRAAISDSP